MSIIYEQKNAREKIFSAVEKMCDFISPTFGPAGNKCIIDRQLWRKVVDDGVAIARDFELPDECENAIVKVVREAAIKTNDRVGDGTTGALIILQAIMSEIRAKDLRSGRIRRELCNELKTAAEEAKQTLASKAKQISTVDDLERAALVSYDNAEIAKMIAQVVHYTGKDGVITVDNSNTLETSYEKTPGLEFASGYVSPFMTNDPIKALADLRDCRIIVTSYRVTNFHDFVGIFNKMIAASHRECLFICENVESDALATLITNRIKGAFLAVAVTIPKTNTEAWTREEFARDVALLTGAKVFSPDIGNKLDNAEVKDLGRADRVIVRNNKCTIIGGKGRKADIEKEKFHIKDLIEQGPKDGEKRRLQSRLARLTNGIGVIKVGAPTENEAKSAREKVDDAVNATQAALRGGVVPGAGRALACLETSSDIFNRALRAPFKIFNENMGLEESFPVKPEEAYNPVTGKRGNYFKVGVMDPVDVLIAQIDSSVSIATQLLTSYGILVESKDKEDKKL